MSLLSTVLYVVGAAHSLAGVPPLLAPGFVCDRLPPRYAEAVGGRREWRRFGAGVTSVGISLLVVAGAVA